MKYRTVVMYIEMGCFTACVCGWILVCVTLPIPYWTYSEVATSVLINSHRFSNLWKDCMSDETGMIDCKVFPTLLFLETQIHLCRALIFTSIVLGFLGAILALIGMKCTKLGGSEITNARITFAAGIIYFASGFCAMVAFSLYGNKIITDFLDPTFQTKKFELGVALFIGWVGSALLIIGGLIYSIFAGREGCETSPIDQEKLVYSTSGAPSPDMLESIKEEEKRSPSPLSSVVTKELENASNPPSKAHKGEYV